MATLKDDIEIIKTAVYGKEMRPAIVDALNQSWGSVDLMMHAVDQLNERVDKLSGGGSEVIDTVHKEARASADGSVTKTIIGYATPV